MQLQQKLKVVLLNHWKKSFPIVMTIKLNGTSQGAWDGSSAKTIDITAASVGATNVTLRRW